MPNWCDNHIEVSHKDPAMMERFKKAFDEGKLLQEFVPCPDELNEEVPVGDDWQERREAKEKYNFEKYGHSDWYSWNIENWGTKWDISEGEFDYDSETNSGSGYFNSAWSPPIAAMEKLTDLGFDVNLKYYEPGVGFIGEYTSDGGDDCYDIEFEDEDWRDCIPENLIDHYNLEEEYENWIEWNKEELSEDDNS